MSGLDYRLQSLVSVIRLLNERHDVCIAAMDPWLGIGSSGDLLHRHSQDMRFFKAVTMDRKLVMGRKTYESLPRRLERRDITIVSRQPEYASMDTVVPDIETTLEDYPAFIAGGGRIYQRYMNYCQLNELDSFHVLTTLHVDKQEADTHYPALERYAELDYLEQVVIPASDTEPGLTVSLVLARPVAVDNHRTRVNKFNRETGLWCYGQLEGKVFFDFIQGQTFSTNQFEFA